MLSVDANLSTRSPVQPRLEPQQSGYPVHAGPLLSIVVPTFNEKDNVGELVRRIAAVLDGVDWEVIFVDDDSPDGTARVAKRLTRRDHRVRCLRRVGRRGLAGACIEGMMASSAPYVAVMDGDLQHDETILMAMLETLRAGDTELVVGSRLVEGGDDAGGFDAGRRMISQMGTRLAGLVLPGNVRDTMSGFFMVRRDLVDRIAPDLCTDGFKILADILATAGPGLAVREIGYHFRTRQHGESKLDLRVGLDFIGLIVNKLSRGAIPPGFVAFAGAGALGLVLHLAVLSGLLTLELGFGTAQTVATLSAMVFNFGVNNLIQGGGRRLRGMAALRGLILFCCICSISAIANIGAAVWLFEHSQLWLASGLAGVVVGATWNYGLSNRMVWRR